MKLRVEWSHVCVADVRRMRWEIAARVCKAVVNLSGGGPVRAERVRRGEPWLIRVRALGGAALVRVDFEERTLFVWRIYTTAR